MRRLLAVAIALSVLFAPAPARGQGPADQTPIDQIDWGQAPEYRIVPGDELALNFVAAPDPMSCTILGLEAILNDLDALSLDGRRFMR